MINNGSTTRRRVAVITGADRGIGKATALRLAKEGFSLALASHTKKSGQAVSLLSRSVQKRYGIDCVAVRVDMADEKTLKSAIAKIKEQYGVIDVLIHNAGINGLENIYSFSPSDFDRIMAVNTRGALSLTKYALPLLSKSTEARIVFVASATPFLGSPGKISYVASKAALIGAGRALARELAPRILVNSVAPGYIDTAMLRQYSIEPLKYKLKKIPLHRFGGPDEVAAAISFLCSKDASYITGQTIHVNGGLFFS